MSLINLKTPIVHILRKAQTLLKMGPHILTKDPNSVELAINILHSGGVIALPTDTVYGLACSATNTEGISNLYHIKKRNENKPVAICVGKVEDVQLWAEVSHLPQGLLHSLLPGPVTLVLKCINKLDKSLSVNDKVGIRIPNYPFIINIANSLECPIALTSANLSNEPSSIKVTEFKSLWNQLSAVFDGGTLGLGDSNRSASTVVDLTEPGKYFIMREGIACNQTVTMLKNYGLEL